MNPKPINPYYNTSRIEDSKFFFGRRTEIELILNALLSEVPQCVSVVGQRKIGKSSLVHHLSNLATIRDFQFNPDNLVFVYFDCQKRAHALRNTVSFYNEILECLRGALPPEVSQDTFAHSEHSFVGQELENTLQVASKSGFTVILILDEFDKAVAQEILVKEGFFGSLRGYTQANRNFAWITCSSRSLHYLFEEAFNEFHISSARQKSESDFYNIAPEQTLRLFRVEETEELLSVPSRSYGFQFTSTDKRTIRELAGDFPYFIQRSCYHLCNSYLQGEDNPAEWRGRALREFRPLWKDYWRKLNDSQKRDLHAIALDQADFLLADIEILKDYSLVNDEGGKIRIFSEQFGRFVHGQSEEASLASAPIPDLDLEIQKVRVGLEREKTNRAKVEQELLDEKNRAKMSGLEIFRLEQLVTRRTLLGRILGSLLFATISFTALFLIPLIWQWNAFLTHPKKRGLYACISLIILGISWMIIDPAKRVAVLLSIVVAAFLVFIQIS